MCEGIDQVTADAAEQHERNAEPGTEPATNSGQKDGACDRIG